MVILELIELAKDLTSVENVSKDSELTEDEYAFYETLALNETAKLEMGDEILKQIAMDLTMV
jgi:type I restriction enzyme R subunit